jgi:hypothetical protein
MSEDERLLVIRYSKAMPTRTLLQHITDLQKLLSLNSLDELKQMGCENKKNLTLDEIKERAKFEIETYTKEIEQLKEENHGNN